MQIYVYDLQLIIGCSLSTSHSQIFLFGDQSDPSAHNTGVPGSFVKK